MGNGRDRSEHSDRTSAQPVAAWSDLHAQVHQTLRTRGLLPQGARLVVAVSGGQDSIALLKLLVDLQPKWHWAMQAVHCDHRWRPDSAENAAFVSQVCHGWGIACQVVTATQSPKTEAAARTWRYDVFSQVATTAGATHIVTGHTATDRAETLLYNLVRGSGSDGLGTLKWQRPLQPDSPHLQVVRPLLGLTRSDTAQFCHRFSLPHWEDATNQDLAYARNRLRLAVFPQLRQHFNPQVDHTLAHTADILAAETELLAHLAEELYQTVVEQPSETSWHLRRSPLQVAPLALQRRVMRQVLQTAMAAPVNFHHVEKLVALIATPNRRQTDPFPGGWIAQVEGDWIYLTRLP